MRRKFFTCWSKPALALLAFLQSLPAQSSGVLTVTPPAQFSIKRGATVPVKIAVQLKQGYHVNSTTPTESYLIPLKLTWTAAPLEVEGMEFPKAQSEKYDFADKPLSVYTGDFDVVTRFKAPQKAETGLQVLSGKLRYQACSHKECLPPKTIDIKVPVNVN